MRRKRRKQKKLIIILSLSLLMVITVGYAAFSTNLSITAKGNIKEFTIEDYVKDGLFAFYDGIENTANGHGAPTDTWYNKALDLNPNLATQAKSTLTNFTASSWTNDNGLLFNGIDNMVDTGYMQEALGQQITLSFVVSTTSTNNYRGYFGYHEGTEFNYGFDMQFNNNEINYGYYGDNINCGFSISEEIINNQIVNKKVNITAILSAQDKISVYFNKQKIGETTCSNVLEYFPAYNFIIGKSLPSDDRYFEGTMYNFMVYKKALTEEEIMQNYKVNKQRYDLE